MTVESIIAGGFLFYAVIILICVAIRNTLENHPYNGDDD